MQESKVTFSDEEKIHRGEMTDTLNRLEIREPIKYMDTTKLTSENNKHTGTVLWKYT